MRIAYLTAGAGGMYCGSCMRDNTLVRAMTELGFDAVLVPTYTPIRTDEQDVSEGQVFLGGINVFLQQKIPLLRWLPRWADRFLDRPGLIRWATRGGIQPSDQQLGQLTVSMLRGAEGRQRKEFRRLCDWLRAELAPDVVVLSNLLIGGGIPQLRRELGAQVLVTLQGDDIFLDSLIEPYRQQALDALRKLVPAVDGFLVNSRFYGEQMGAMLKIPDEKLHVVPLGLDTEDFLAAPPSDDGDAQPPTIGYLARLAPEKGLHRLVDGFLRLRQQVGLEEARLRIAGWLGPQHEAFAQEQFQRLDAAGLQDSYEYVGEVDRQGKLEFLRGIDVLSVPTEYLEPKGLYVLEALAAGVPVVQPRHGEFPELLASTGGGLLVPPDDPAALAGCWQELLTDHPRRRRLAEEGRSSVLQRHTAESMAEATLRVIESL